MTKEHQKQTISEEFKFGKERFTCEICFRDIKKLRIIVYPDQRVEVRSPLRYDHTKVLEEVKKRAPWIIKQREYFRQFMPRLPEKQYVSGETFYYLGRQYRLRIRKDSKYSTRLRGKFIWVTVPDLSKKQKVKKMVQNWYKEHARATFERRLQACLESVKRYKLPRPQLKLRRMTRRWGSCGNNGSIVLNTELVKVPIHCIDYVIMHELCHQKYPRHNLRFLRLLSALMPDWQQRKQRLETVTI